MVTISTWVFIYNLYRSKKYRGVIAASSAHSGPTKVYPQAVGFNFSTEYKPGIKNLVANGLSIEFDRSKDEDIEKFFMLATGPISTLVEQIKREYSTDAHLIQLHKQHQEGSLDQDYMVREGMVFFQGKYLVAMNLKLCVKFLMNFKPPQLQDMEV